MKYLCICYILTNGKICVSIHDAAVVVENYELTPGEYFTDVKPSIRSVEISDFTEVNDLGEKYPIPSPGEDEDFLYDPEGETWSG
jgi:hypothetical protein